MRCAASPAPAAVRISPPWTCSIARRCSGFAADWRPEAILHLATAIPPAVDSRRAVEQFGPTNRLRTEGTRNLVAAAEAAGGARLIAQSIAFMSRPGEGLASEDDPLRDGPGDVMEGIAAPVAELERLTIAAGGTVLRFGWFYGPDTGFAADGGFGSAARAGKLPILTKRGRTSTFSFIHVDDAAAALVAALDHDVSGIFNIVDDEPAPNTEWLPGARRRLRGQAAPAAARLARPAARRRLRDRDDDRAARRSRTRRPRPSSAGSRGSPPGGRASSATPD